MPLLLPSNLQFSLLISVSKACLIWQTAHLSIFFFTFYCSFQGQLDSCEVPRCICVSSQHLSQSHFILLSFFGQICEVVKCFFKAQDLFSLKINVRLGFHLLINEILFIIALTILNFVKLLIFWYLIIQ